jgi:hypothetical protein
VQIVDTPGTDTDVANETSNASRLANKLANATGSNLANDTPGRNRASTTYRYRNPDKRRLYQRDLMRQKRAAHKQRVA